MYKIFSTVLIAFLFTACQGENKEQTNEKKAAKIVKVYDLKNSSTYKKTSSYPALVYSLQDTTMAFEVSGKITKFYFNEGDFVKKGSIIAKLDDTIYKANYNSALANYNQAKLDFKRYKKLYNSKSIAKRDLEQVKQKLDVTRSNLNIANKNLKDTKLVAEFDGIMAKKLVKDFERITAKQAIIRLQDNSSYKIKFFAPENDVLEVNQKITEENAAKFVDFKVTVGKLKEKINGRFIDISTTAEEVSRTFEVTLQIDSIKNKNIFPGMTAHVDVIRKNNEDKALLIPLKALFSDETDSSYVWVLDEKNIVKKQKVITGKLQKDMISIKKGLDKTSKIVISGVRFLEENEQVKLYKKIGN